ncbi:MAG: M20 family metallo-hydrolase [Flavobacteriaceae bacterium]
MNELIAQSILLLKELIKNPSFSGEETATAACLIEWFDRYVIPYHRIGNTVYALHSPIDSNKPTLLLNSHHDTVRPNKGYTKDPFDPIIEEGKLYGLGSNDAGGALVSLLATFTHFYATKNLKYNLIFVASVEEETAGPNSLRGILKQLPPIDLAVVGEPTQMQLAIAEKGLVVLDANIPGTSGHAAHPNEDNPIYKVPEIINWFKNFRFEKTSNQLGPVKMTVTQLQAGSQHNVVPAEVKMVVDVRVNDCYSNQEVYDLLRKSAPCQLQPRSLHLNSSSIPVDHPLVKAGVALGRSTYGSPTLSDMAALTCPSLKLGPGDSTRSHQADEFIYIDEIEEAIPLYINILEQIL